MAAASFDDCYAQICALLDLEPVPLEIEETGDRAFTVTYRQTEFSFAELKQAGSDCMSMLVKFGVPPPDKSGQILAILMGVNFAMVKKGAAAFAQAPQTGDIFLHRVVPLSQLHIPGLQTVLDQFAEQVARWSRDYFLDGEEQVTNGHLDIANLA